MTKGAVSTSFNPLGHPILWANPRRLTSFSAWRQHIPTAFLLTELLKPNLFVELGTHHGDSYCAFCQAVQTLGLDTRCYAVDTWRGDEQSLFYGPEVVFDLRSHHDPLYGHFSTLIQSTFDEALTHFVDATIDLLHIDGYHTYEAVRHDFESWLPKLSRKGVVLLHDTNVREGTFGVWRLWDEMKNRYPHFEFRHGHGLGILAVGEDRSPAFNDFLSMSADEAQRVRELVFHLAQRLELQVQLTTQLTEQETAHAALLSNAQEQLKKREAELRGLLLNAHEQLRQRDAALREVQVKYDAALREVQVKYATALNEARNAPSPISESLSAEVVRLQGKIKHMQGTRVWRLGYVYYRIQSWLRTKWKVIRVSRGLLHPERHAGE